MNWKAHFCKWFFFSAFLGPLFFCAFNRFLPEWAAVQTAPHDFGFALAMAIAAAVICLLDYALWRLWGIKP